MIAGTVLLITLAASSAFAHPMTPDRQLSQLVAESQLSKQACDSFKRNVLQFVPKRDPVVPLKNVKQVSDLLTLVKQYPGSDVIPFAQDAAQLVLSDQGKTVDLRKVGQLEVCEPMALYDAERALIISIASLHLPQEKAQEISTQVQDDVKGRFPPMLLDQSIRIALVGQLQDKHLIHVKDPGALHALAVDAQKYRKELEKTARAPKQKTILRDMQRAKELSDRLDQII